LLIWFISNYRLEYFLVVNFIQILLISLNFIYPILEIIKRILITYIIDQKGTIGTIKELRKQKIKLILSRDISKLKFQLYFLIILYYLLPEIRLYSWIITVHIGSFVAVVHGQTCLPDEFIPYQDNFNLKKILFLLGFIIISLVLVAKLI